MSIELTRADVTLEKRGIAVLKRARGVRLLVTCGTAWLTIDGERNDVVLNAGDRFVVASDADVAVSAIAGPVVIAVRPAAPVPAAVTGFAGPAIRTLARLRRAFATPVAAEMV